jgi:hypothetical protein
MSRGVIIRHLRRLSWLTLAVFFVGLFSVESRMPRVDKEAAPGQVGTNLATNQEPEPQPKKQNNLIVLSGPGLKMTFQYEDRRLGLIQMQRQGDPPLLYSDIQAKDLGSGPTGNPLAVVVRDGKYKGVHGARSFHVTKLDQSERHLLAYLEHDSMPLLVAVDVTIEGNVASWRGQVCWNGDETLEADIYFPLLSRVRFDQPQKDRALVAQISGSVLSPLGDVNYSQTYVGQLSCPVFLIEGGGRGLAVLDDNRADYAADPGATSRRSVVIGNTFPVPVQPVRGGEQGPFIGIRHTRIFRSIGVFGGEETYERAEKPAPLPMRKLGDAIDLGPIDIYAYQGTWKAGAAWLRAQRHWIPFRVSPARWYQSTTFLAEDMGDVMVRKGQSFYDYAKVLAEKRRLGADLFHLPGFHDPEMLGTSLNWLNRGDYFFAAQNLGGFEGARRGVEGLHRAGGHILYYVEGLIVWKRSRIGRTHGKEWALMEPDGTYTEHYKGFWHICPAVKEWQDWIAGTCAEIVKTTGVDGFFIDSLLATYNHRCFNPAHRHPHPDVWNWGVRQTLRRIREEAEKVDPETILLVEGCGDIGREYADGFVSHGHMWTNMTLSEPLVRFLHPDMRAYESWGSNPPPSHPPQKLHVWNSVNGYRIYSHNPHQEEMASLSLRTRRYYDAFPEICDNPMSVLEAGCENCIAQLFEGAPYILTVGNVTDQSSQAVIEIPVPSGELFDRVDSTRVAVVQGKGTIKLSPWEFRAFEVRP